MSTTGQRSGFLKRTAGVAGATALLMAGGMVTALPAAAGPSCASGYHCVFSFRFGGPSHSYFNSDPDFTNDYWDDFGSVRAVNDDVMSASNSSNSGYESHYYKDVNYGGGLLFCVNPGSSVEPWELADWQKNAASSLRIRSTTTIPCF